MKVAPLVCVSTNLLRQPCRLVVVKAVRLQRQAVHSVTQGIYGDGVERDDGGPFVAQEFLNLLELGLAPGRLQLCSDLVDQGVELLVRIVRLVPLRLAPEDEVQEFRRRW